MYMVNLSGKMGGWVDPLLKEDAFGGTKEMEQVEKDFVSSRVGCI